MVAMGLSTVIALGSTGLMTNTVREQVILEDARDLNATKYMIYQDFIKAANQFRADAGNLNDVCGQRLQITSSNANLANGVSVPVRLNAPGFVSDGQWIQAGSELANTRFQVSSFNLTDMQGLGTDINGNQLFQGSLVMSGEQRLSGQNRPVRPHTLGLITLSVDTSNNNQVVSCAPQEHIADVQGCGRIGLEFDPFSGTCRAPVQLDPITPELTGNCNAGQSPHFHILGTNAPVNRANNNTKLCGASNQVRSSCRQGQVARGIVNGQVVCDASTYDEVVAIPNNISRTQLASGVASRIPNSQSSVPVPGPIRQTLASNNNLQGEDYLSPASDPDLVPRAPANSTQCMCGGEPINQGQFCGRCFYEYDENLNIRTAQAPNRNQTFLCLDGNLIAANAVNNNAGVCGGSNGFEVFTP